MWALPYFLASARLSRFLSFQAIHKMDAENKSQGPNSDDDQERQIENESNRLFTANPQSLPDVRSQPWRNQSVPNLPLFGPTDSDTASTSIPVAEKFHFQKRVCR